MTCDHMGFAVWERRVCTLVKRGSSIFCQHERGQTERKVKEPVPRVMWWTCLPSDDEFDWVPAALAVLHKHRHWILPTRQRTGEWLASHPHPLNTTSTINSPHAFRLPLVDSGRD